MCNLSTWHYINPCIYLPYSVVLLGSLLAMDCGLLLRSVSDLIYEYSFSSSSCKNIIKLLEAMFGI